MKKIAFILLLLMSTTALGYAQDMDEYYTKEISTRGIKQITEKSGRRMTALFVVLISTFTMSRGGVVDKKGV